MKSHSIFSEVEEPLTTIDLSGSKPRRKFSTKDVPECKICSDGVFEICHPHISTLEILSNANGHEDGNILCPMCHLEHPRDLEANSERRRIVMGSSDLVNIWKTKSFKPNFHVDFDCIIGGKIHDTHASFMLQYQDAITSPLDIILVCGINNIPSSDTWSSIATQFKSFVKTVKRHSKHNRVVICPILFAPKFCDNRLLPTANYLTKLLEVNRWIKNFNLKETGVYFDLSQHGVLTLPENVDQGVAHDYSRWREPNWRKMLHLTQDAKEAVAVKIIQTFKDLDKLS